MSRKPIIKSNTAVPKDRALSKVTMFFFNKPLLTAILWIAVTLFGTLSYTTFLTREGFPSVNIPLAIVGGTYFVNDPAKVDDQVAKPISDIALQQDGVKSVQTQSAGNFFSAQVTYENGVDAKAATEQLEQKVKESGKIPQQATVQYKVPFFGATGPSEDKLDIAISFYPESGNAPIEEIVKKANDYVKLLKEKNINDVEDIYVKNPFEQTVNPTNGQAIEVQKSFDRFGIRENNESKYHSSVIIGISAKSGFDVIKLDNDVRAALEATANNPTIEGYSADISASFAPNIKENISELQRSLLEGLIAVLVVGAIVIALRASLITVISMVTVVAITLGLLYSIGYTLNVITLFSLILALALIVDDTIIMVEAIDVSRHHNKDRNKTVREASRRVSRAMVAATATAALSFAPLLFVGGVLGTFIRAIPITIISSLVISLLVALIFIPFFARYLLLGPKQMGKKGVTEVASGFEASIAKFITKPMVWARHSTRKLFAVGSGAMIIGFGFIFAGLIIAKNVTFNIFPPTKDTNGIVLNITFPPNLTIEQAEKIAAEADGIAARELGENFEQGSYFGSGNQQNATQRIEIMSYTKRDITSPELVNKLQQTYNKEFASKAQVAVGQIDVGPPSAAFVVQITAEDRDAALRAAEDVKVYLENHELVRANGTTAKFVNVNVSSPNQYIRDEGKPIVTVSAGFNSDDVSALVTIGETDLKEEFDANKLATYGLPADAINLNLGQESENQESFATLALAFPILLLVMYILLLIQFKSFLQPLLIFLAIPFSLFGIALGLDLTNNAFSFFAMLGFFALLGLSIKNTILLTDYANQARKEGNGVVDSAIAALRERFRPLFATSVTAIVSLIPLALTSPFWEGLMVVLIFGLLSSTFLVVTVFPYYYLGAEYLRLNIGAKRFFIWFMPTLIAAIVVGKLLGIGWAVTVIPLSFVLISMQRFYLNLLSK
ncbi:MAG: efflux RND transporter permease subunit [Candidatus Saccharimonadales bacterium]